MLKRNLYLLLAVFFLNSFPFLVHAGIGVKPTVTELSLSPGKKKAGIFTVLNDGEETVKVKVELEDWRRREEEVRVDSWLKIKPREFKLAPGKVRKVKYKIKVPEEAEGEMVAMVFFGSLAPAGGGVGIKTRFGVSIYVGIKGTEVIEANINNSNKPIIGKTLMIVSPALILTIK